MSRLSDPLSALPFDSAFLEAFEAAGLGRWSYNVETGEVVLSNALRQLLELSDSTPELTRATALALLHPNDQEDAMVSIQRSIEKREPLRHEVRIVTARGSVKWFDIRGHATGAVSGRPSAVLGLAIDITERKTAQTMLRQAEERFRVAAACASDLIYEWDVDTGAIRWYGDVTRHFGYSAQEAPATFSRWQEIIHPEDRKRVLSAIERNLLTRAPYHEEYRVVGRSGTITFWSERSAVLYDATGRPWRWIGVGSNVTTLRRSAAALAESEDRFRKLAERVRVIPWEADARTGQFTYVGPQAEQVLGFPVERWLENDFWPQHIHGSDRDTAVTFCIEQSKIVDDYEFEYRMIAGDGSEVWLYDIVNVVRSAGEPVTLRGFMIDITERKAAEHERQQLLVREQQARHDAENASRSKDEFLATVSHELRTPLTSILGWSQMLQNGLASTPELQQRAAAAIERNARAQAQLIDDILDVSRVVTGNLRVEKRSLEIGPLIHAAVESVRPAAQEKGLTVDVELEPDLPRIEGDPDRIQQILGNLLGNSIKFTARGRVLVRAAIDAGALTIRVTDTGIGIAADLLPYVFDQFRQGDGTSRRKHGGLGLGLAIVRHLVQAHGGTVTAESAGEGCGSSFIVSLPACSSPAVSTRVASGERLKLPNNRLAGLSILVVDDEPDVRQLLNLLLSRCGASVVMAGGAGEAWQRLEDTKIDLMLSDIAMPGEDGYSLIRSIRNSDRSFAAIPAIALTAFARPSDRSRAIEAGFQQHLPKPVAIENLAGAIADLLEAS